MNVTEIINRIATISLNEDSPDADIQTRLVRYINDAYFEVYRETAKMYKNRLLTSEAVTITNGAGTISVTPFSWETVKDTVGKQILKPSDIEEIDEIDIEIDDTGNPTRYYITTGTTVNTHPINSTTILVRYIPEATVLSVSSTEADIKISVMFQEILVWGAIFMMFLDERDTRTELEIQVAQAKFDDKLTRLKSHLDNQPKRKVRVKGSYF